MGKTNTLRHILLIITIINITYSAIDKETVNQEADSQTEEQKPPVAPTTESIEGKVYLLAGLSTYLFPNNAL